MTNAIEKVLNQPVTIIDKGRRRRVTKKEVIAMQLVGQATQGELRAAQHVMNASRQNDDAAHTPASAESWAFTDDDQKVIAQVVERILLSAQEKPS
jgi:hypothetical protein